MPVALRDRWRAVRATLAPPYWHEVLRAIGPAKSVLDVGCGASSPLAEGRARFERLVGVDAFPEAIEASRKRGSHDELIELNVRRLAERFSPAPSTRSSRSTCSSTWSGARASSC